MGAVRVRRVSGAEGRRNDAVFVPAPAPPPAPSPQQTLVFFGGDVQDYPEVMQAHRDNRNYLKWNLESTARMLSRFFPAKHVVVIRPSRIEYKSFSCYDNFVPSNNAGVPDHTPTHSALKHLERLLQGITTRIKSLPASDITEALSSPLIPEEVDIENLHSTANRSETDKSNGTRPSQDAVTVQPERNPDEDPLSWRDNLQLETSALTLVGFSKGCVVLNQLVYEFHYTKTLTPSDVNTIRFMERIEALYWLDGGHAGGKNTWITSRSLLETLTRMNVSVYIHVSPYQVRDEGRPWIGKEERTFTSMLKKLGANVQRYIHEPAGMKPSLHMHFEVLGNFKQMQDSGAAGPVSLAVSDDDT